MDQTDFIQLVEETLEVRPGTISLDDNLKSIDWDSLADISFIAAVDDNLGITLDAQGLNACETPRDLLALVSAAIGGK